MYIKIFKIRDVQGSLGVKALLEVEGWAKIYLPKTCNDSFSPQIHLRFTHTSCILGIYSLAVHLHMHFRCLTTDVLSATRRLTWQRCGSVLGAALTWGDLLLLAYFCTSSSSCFWQLALLTYFSQKTPAIIFVLQLSAERRDEREDKVWGQSSAFVKFRWIFNAAIFSKPDDAIIEIVPSFFVHVFHHSQHAPVSYWEMFICGFYQRQHFHCPANLSLTVSSWLPWQSVLCTPQGVQCFTQWFGSSLTMR